MIITLKIKSLTSKVNFPQNLRFLTSLFLAPGHSKQHKQNHVDVEQNQPMAEHDIEHEPRGNEWDAW